jgi:hypothetical protein
LLITNLNLSLKVKALKKESTTGALVTLSSKRPLAFDTTAIPCPWAYIAVYSTATTGGASRWRKARCIFGRVRKEEWSIPSPSMQDSFQPYCRKVSVKTYAFSDR